MTRLLAALLLVIGIAQASAEEAAMDLAKPDGAIRVATYNIALARQGAGLALRDIEDRHPQVLAVAEIILRVRPDILLLNELDADPEGRSLAAFRALLAAGAGGQPGLDYGHGHQAPQNVGVPSGLDIDGDGRAAGPDDAWGYGRFPGQYAMAVLSRYPFGEARAYSLFRWAAMPEARRPVLPDGTPYHADPVWQALRLSSKAHWDLTVATPQGPLRLLAAHPTPPVFDGPEDKNGRRNADEIRLLGAMIDGPAWLRDDAGRPAGIPPGTAFVVAGDLNADPQDGDGIREAIAALLAHPRIADPRPRSEGGPAAAARADHPPVAGDPALHTADWNLAWSKHRNLRVDYVLPSREVEILGAGVFWPAEGSPGAPLLRMRGRTHRSSDHRLVWADIRLP